MKNTGEDGRADFLDRYGEIFEHSRWVAEAAWEARPFADVRSDS